MTFEEWWKDFDSNHLGVTVSNHPRYLAKNVYDYQQSKIDIAIEALEYYADHDHPRGRVYCQDGGIKAKEALEKLK
jgi:hypothetical protein